MCQESKTHLTALTNHFHCLFTLALDVGPNLKNKDRALALSLFCWYLVGILMKVAAILGGQVGH